MDREAFEKLVADAVAALPEEFASKLDNVDVIVQNQPDANHLRKARLRRGHGLLGLYEGVPLTRRSSGYGMVTPDRITIFQRPIEASCRGNDEIVARIGQVVRHEIAHHFGINDSRLAELEGRRDPVESGPAG